MAWFYLFLAGVFEIAWAYGLKLTAGWTRFWPSAFTLLTMGVSFAFLSLAMRQIPMGTAYAVWTGIGIVGTTVVGMTLLGEPRDGFRLFCLALVVAGIVGLKLSSSDSSSRRGNEADSCSNAQDYTEYPPPYVGGYVSKSLPDDESASP